MQHPDLTINGDEQHTQQGLHARQQQQHPTTQLLDIPSHLLEPHMQQQLQPQGGTALLRSSKVLGGLALSSTPSLLFSIGITAQGQVCGPQHRAPATAAWAISHCPGLTLRLHSTSSSTQGTSSSSSSSSTTTTTSSTTNAEPSTAAPSPHALSPQVLLPQLGQVLTSLKLEVGA
jgi:hypothetical protein